MSTSEIAALELHPTNPTVKRTVRYNHLGGAIESFLDNSDNLQRTDEVIAAEWFVTEGDGSNWDRDGIRLEEFWALRERVLKMFKAAHDSQRTLLYF